MIFAPKQARGFTLIELLVALVVIALGILGYAILHLRAMEVGHQSRYAQQANNALLDLSQRISALPDAAVAGEFDQSNLADGSAPPYVDCITVGTSCNRAEFAQYEVAEWWQQASPLLPELRFSIATAGNLVSITAIWDANRSGVGSGECDLSGQGHQCGSIELWLR